MPPFARNPSAIWHQEVPGSRWFRADLHVHTLDDHPNANLRRPPGLGGAATNQATRDQYARAFLRSAIANHVQVLGLTPHSARSGEDNSSSATWRIVEEWNAGNDDDGVPFRDKIYAVFPGFEPSLSDGAAGIHLLFLFDPEIGRDQFLRAFDVVMNGVIPYANGNLRNTTNDSAAVFQQLRELCTSVGGEWRYLCLAPHAFSDRGLFKLQSQILQNFPHSELVALELGDNQLPEDVHAGRPWLADGMARYRHCLFHSSDAYDVAHIGHWFTLVKMGSPRLESLRQALLAPDSRTRIAYHRAGSGDLSPRSDLPDPRGLSRPWLRRVHIWGGTSFFRQGTPATGADPGETFDLSPDLTCIIGGRMSGKSTFLDGLRTRVGLPMPADQSVRQDVESRASSRFLSGGATCDLDVCGPIASTESDALRWPAKFFTQRELQASVRDQQSRRRLLYRLVPDTSGELTELDAEITRLDAEISAAIASLTQRRSEYVAAGQEFQNVERARDALARFRSAGSNELASAQGDEGRVVASRAELRRQRETLSTLIQSACAFSLPRLDEAEIRESLTVPGFPRASKALNRYRASYRLSRMLSHRLDRALEATETRARDLATTRKADVQRRLVEAGGSAEDLNQFEALTAAAADYETKHAVFKNAEGQYRQALKSFARQRRQRLRHTMRRRELMRQLGVAIATKFNGRIRLVTTDDGVFDKLDEWLRSLRNQGVTRWWNERSKQEPAVSPQALLTALRAQLQRSTPAVGGTRSLVSLGMSAQVSTSFISAVGDAERIQLAGLRSEDRYDIVMRVADVPPIYKEMGSLSGGAQVSILLSLILETDDSTPLVIDQPEDEIDKEFLFETVLPALRRLKGRRQVIFATHDANIVVNGDADQVIQLKAEADAGRVSIQGVIETAAVRDAIVATLDGGRDAFALRRAKYGF